MPAEKRRTEQTDPKETEKKKRTRAQAPDADADNGTGKYHQSLDAALAEAELMSSGKMLTPEARIRLGRSNRKAMFRRDAEQKRAEISEKLEHIAREDPSPLPEGDTRFRNKLNAVLDMENGNADAPSARLSGQPNNVAKLLSELNEHDLAALRTQSETMTVKDLSARLRSRAYPDYYPKEASRTNEKARTPEKTRAVPARDITQH